MKQMEVVKNNYELKKYRYENLHKYLEQVQDLFVVIDLSELESAIEDFYEHRLKVVKISNLSAAMLDDDLLVPLVAYMEWNDEYISRYKVGKLKNFLKEDIEAFNNFTNKLAHSIQQQLVRLLNS